MTGNMNQFGRVMLSDSDIRLKRWLGFIGRAFVVPLTEIEGWQVVDINTQINGQDRCVDRILELFHADDVKLIFASQTGGRFDELVSAVRYRLPDKKVQPDEAPS